MKMKYAKGAPKKASEKVQDKKASAKVQNASNPFAGKIFYLDLTSKVVSEKLEKDIKELGGTVEGFLSKEITFLITNKKVAANPKVLKLLYSKQPEPERTTGENSSCQSGEGGSRKKTEKGLASRGKSLVEKAIQEHALLPENSILSNALNWGVRIMHVDEAKLLIEMQKQFSLKPKKEQTQHSAAAPSRPTQPTAKKRRGPYLKQLVGQKLAKPYLKVEDNECQYLPTYLTKCTLTSFQRPKYSRQAKVVKKASVPKATATKNRNEDWRLKALKKSGYCECCLEKYDNLEAHVSGQKHRRFAAGPHYQIVDALVSSFEFDFVEWPRFRKHCQCIGVQVPRVPIQNYQAQYISPIEYMEVDIIRVANPGGPHPEVHSLDKTSDHSVTVTCAPYPGVVQHTSRITDAVSLRPENNAAPLVCLKPGLPLSVDEEMLSVANIGIDSPVNERLAQEAVDLKAFEPEHAANLQKHVTESMDDGQEVSASLLYPSGGVTAPDMDSGSAALSHRTAETNECKANPEDTLLPNQLASPVVPQSEGSDSRKLIRKVKTLKRSRNTESQSCTPTYYKVSVIQKAGPCTAQNSLLKLFESSNKDSEFFGFTCSSVESSSKDVDNMAQSDSQIQELFSHTSSSFSTFEGF